jgi:hypothetical protein
MKVALRDFPSEAALLWREPILHWLVDLNEVLCEVSQ